MTSNTSTGRLSQTASIWLSRRLRLWTPGEWRESVYTPEIDTLLAQIALDTGDPIVSEAAARAIGSMRSQAALQHIAKAQAAGEKGALRALALIRDEAPSLPGVSAQARLYAWLTNTLRRFSSQPMQIVSRFIWAFIGAAFGIGYYVWATLNSGTTGVAVLNNQNLALTISLMLFFGVGFGVCVVLGAELPRRLMGFWPWWARLGMSLLLGTLSGTFIFSLYTFMFLNYAESWTILLPGGLGLALGLAVSTQFKLRGWLLALIMATCFFVPMYFTWNNSLVTGSAPVIYFRQQPPEVTPQVLSIGIPLALAFGIGAYGVMIWQEVRSFVQKAAALRAQTRR